MASHSLPALLTTWKNLSDSMLRRLAKHKARLNVGLQHPPNPYFLRLDLAEAQADGFDPKTLYEQALVINRDSKYTPPAWEDVAPAPPTSAKQSSRMLYVEVNSELPWLKVPI